MLSDARVRECLRFLVCLSAGASIEEATVEVCEPGAKSDLHWVGVHLRWATGTCLAACQACSCDIESFELLRCEDDCLSHVLAGASVARVSA